MKNKIFIGLLFGCFLNIYGQGSASYPQDGIYGGLESGAAFIRVNGAFGSNIFVTESEEFISQDYIKNVVSINLGYGKYLGESFIGIEAHHSIYTTKISDSFVQSDFNFDISIASKSEIDLIIGRKIGERSLLTLRGGIAFSNINVIAAYNLGNDVYVLDKQWDGFSLGMGYVYGLNDNLSIKSKYTLTIFNNNELPITNSKLVDNRATLSLIYRIWSVD